MSGLLDLIRKGIRAYHGSPHDFDRFDISKIGTGEGAQAYGHGLYFAEREGTAKAYRDQLKGRYYKTDDGIMEGYDARRAMIDQMEAAAPGLHPDQYGQIATEILNSADRAGGARKFIREYEPHGGVFRAASEAARKVAGDLGLRPHKGHMYEVNINAAPDQFLDWDTPIKAQPQHVQEFAERVGIRPDDFGFTRGGAVNAKAGDYFGPSGGTSNFSAAATAGMRDAGIPGIRYLDQGSRAPGGLGRVQLENSIATLRDDIARLEQTGGGDLPRLREKLSSFEGALGAMPKASRNYVVFDDSLVDILRKYGLAGIPAAGAAGASFGSLVDDEGL